MADEMKEKIAELLDLIKAGRSDLEELRDMLSYLVTSLEYILKESSPSPEEIN